jgi:hypothetical protein
VRDLRGLKKESRHSMNATLLAFLWSDDVSGRFVGRCHSGGVENTIEAVSAHMIICARSIGEPVLSPLLTLRQEARRRRNIVWAVMDSGLRVWVIWCPPNYCGHQSGQYIEGARSRWRI